MSSAPPVDNPDALRLTEWELNKILDHVPMATWIKDFQGRYTRVNAVFAQVVAREKAEIEGRTDADLWPPKQATLFARGDDEVIRSGRMLRETQVLELPGFHMIAGVVKRPLYSPDGALLGTVGFARDITTERAAEQALLRANEELESRIVERTLELERVQASLVKQERLAALGQLAGGVAHQMRNPLAAITSASYVLRRHLSETAQADAKLALEIILEEARHANDIITGLLDYTRTRAAIARVAAVASLVERALSKSRSRSSVRLELSIDPQLKVLVDAEQVSSALCNLFDNAFDAMPSGGTLTVIAEELNYTHLLRPTSEPPSPRDAPTHCAQLTLHDTGGGIAPERRGLLFTPLSTTKPLGLGLGLVTARTLIERQGGSLDYVPPENEERGATFVVRLPLAAPDDIES